MLACGFCLPTSAHGWVLPGGEAAEREDGVAAKTTALLALGCVGHRMKRDAYIFRGYPGRSALLLSDPATAERALHRLRSDFDVFRLFQDSSGRVAGTNAIADRSLFHDVAVEQLLEILRLSGWLCDQRSRDWIQESFDGPLNSKIVEDSFKSLSEMVKGQRNLKVSAKKAFSHLLGNDVLQGLHRWPTVSPDVLESYGRCAQVPESWFKPDLKHPSVPEMRDVVGFASTVKWYSPGASSLSQQATDLELMKHCERTEQLRSCRDAWFCVFLRAQHQFVCRREGATQWYFPLLEVPDSAAFVWPCTPRAVGDPTACTCFELDEGSLDIADHIFPFTDLRQLEAPAFRTPFPPYLKRM